MSPLGSCFTSTRGAYHNKSPICIYFNHYYAITLDLAQRRLLSLLPNVPRYSILPEHVFASLSTIHLVCMYKKKKLEFSTTIGSWTLSLLTYDLDTGGTYSFGKVTITIMLLWCVWWWEIVKQVYAAHATKKSYCEVSRLLCGRRANLTTEFITGYVAVVSTLSYLVILDILCLLCNKGS
jgi:hypothetical protein